MNGHISPMYRMKPVFELGSDIHVKTTMYGMKNLQASPLQEIGPTQSNLSERDMVIREIESKQAEILKALAGIKAQMAALKEELCKDTDKKSTVKTVPPSKKIDFTEYGIIHEVVVNAKTQKPPYSLLAISRLWDGKINIDLSCHTHSSLKSLPEDLAQFSKMVPRSNANNATDLRIRLVWKEMDSDCEFIVSPFKYLPLTGEVNMLRFLDRVVRDVSKKADEEVGPNELAAGIRRDERLDVCQSLKSATSGKEVHNALKSLGEDLGDQRRWFGGDRPDLVDASAWSALKSADNPKLSKSLASWFQRCEEHFAPRQQ